MHREFILTGTGLHTNTFHCYLQERANDEKKILDDYNSESEVVINKTVRKDHELYTTSTGLVLTAEGKTSFSEKERQIICGTYGSVEKMLALRASVLENGYIEIASRPRIFEVAAAVYKDGAICASVAAYLPEFLVSEAEKRDLIKNLCDTANKISERI